MLRYTTLFAKQSNKQGSNRILKQSDLSKIKEAHGDRLLREIADRIKYFYLQTDGTFVVPNSVEGDIMVMVAALTVITESEE